MTKKDFILIAKVVKDCYPKEIPNGAWGPVFSNGQVNEWLKFAHILASTLEDANPKFERERFLIACGVHEEEPTNG